ncbi:MAG: Holliday junction branch migration protein RuvA [Candidatus Levybacteria bacterium]|nr:Holliday junction branch migration protein RuvA [Candidatus Levybacteria bacterium]
MIGMLTGTVVHIQDTHIILDTHGVGYRVLVPQSIYKKINGDGQQVTIYTYTHVRQDTLELYGFLTHEDLWLFEHLISVSGVGCKTALGVFSVGTRGEIIDAIAKNDVQFFTSVPRLGKKNAQKIIIELKNKVGGSEEFDFGQIEGESKEIVDVLKSFGYTNKEAIDAIRGIKEKGNTMEEKIKLALKYLGK